MPKQLVKKLGLDFLFFLTLNKLKYRVNVYIKSI